MISRKQFRFITIFNIIKDVHRNVQSAACNPQTHHKMQAWQIHSYGDLSDLQFSNARIPTLTHPDDVLIKVKATSLNPIDKMMISGYGRTIFNVFRDNELELPLTIGRDFCGEIVEKGHNVGKKFNVGDTVYGFIPLQKQGSHAEFAIASKDHIRNKPQHLNNIETAAIPYAAMTAWGGLFLAGGLLTKNLKKSQILILGASGGVGTLAVQLLKAYEARVIATCSTDAVPLVNSLGADAVYDYRDSNYEANVATEGRFDVILDCAKFGYENIPKNWNYNAFVTLNSPLLLNTDQHGLCSGLAVSATSLLNANLTRIFEGKTVRWGFFVPSSSGFDTVNKLVLQKKIVPVIHKIFPFKELSTGLKVLSEGHLRGKIVIDFENE